MPLALSLAREARACPPPPGHRRVKKDVCLSRCANYLNRARRRIASSLWQRCAHGRRRAAGAWQLPAPKIPPRSKARTQKKNAALLTGYKTTGRRPREIECDSLVTLYGRALKRTGRPPFSIQP